jgi:transcriptional regulator with XRE-family HTH domain
MRAKHMVPGMNQEMKNPHLAAIIKEFREKRALTQEHLAQLSEVNIRTLQRLESTGACSKENLRAVAEAFDIDVKDLLEAAEKRDQQPGESDIEDIEALAAKHVFVVLHEVIGPIDLINSLAGSHGQMNDFPDNLTDAQAELIGYVLDYLKDYADIQSDIYPSERIRMMQQVKTRLDELKQSGISAFVGQFDQNMVTSNQPDKPFKWTVAVLRLLPVGAKEILIAGDGTVFSLAVIPKRNLRMT